MARNQDGRPAGRRTIFLNRRRLAAAITVPVAIVLAAVVAAAEAEPGPLAARLD